MIKAAFVICVLASALPAMAQEMRPFDDDFVLLDGFYLTFQDFKANNPVPIAAVVTNADVRSADFMNEVLSGTDFTFYDNLGELHTVQAESVWGYARNNQVHIQTQFDISRIMLLGAAGHFTAVVEVITPMAQPFFDPYWGPTSMNRDVRSRELRQFMIDMDNGRVVPNSADELETILARDPQLLAEFQALSTRKRKESVFFYLRKFNQRNPMLLPVR